jgi:hypothetical protein
MRVHGHATWSTSCTAAAFISAELAAAAGFQPGTTCSVYKDHDGIAAPGPQPVVPVYAHPDVSPGHVCMAQAVMQQLAVTDKAQVRASFGQHAPENALW